MRLNTGTRLLILLAVTVAAVIAVGIFLPEHLPSLLGGLRADVRDALIHPYFEIGKLPITPVFLVKAILFLFLLSVVTGAIRRFLLHRALMRTSLDEGQRYAFAHIMGYVVYLTGLLVGLQLVGLDLSSLVLLGSAIGIGLGFGLQNIANNFVSGIILLTERPIRVGDRVEVGGTNGDVVRIGSRSTWVRTNDNVVIIIPNSEFINNRVTNWTANDRQVRFSVPLGVSYGSDPERVREVLLEVAGNHPDVLKDPEPEILFAGFGDSSLNFELRVWTIARVKTPLPLSSELYFSIFRAFKENGIEIPFPQRDLHIKTVSPFPPGRPRWRGKARSFRRRGGGMNRRSPWRVLPALLPLMLLSTGAWAAKARPGPEPAATVEPAKPAAAPVGLDGKTLFFVRERVMSFTPEDRAGAIRRKLEMFLKDPLSHPETITVLDAETTSQIMAGEVVLMTITDRDAAAEGKPRAELAKESRRACGPRSAATSRHTAAGASFWDAPIR